MTAIDLAEMPISEKLKLMEALWESLGAESDENVVSPAWHGAVLEARLRGLASGADTTEPWRDAKERIREQVKPA